MIDDSIVRGTTSRPYRSAFEKKRVFWVAIGSPALAYPCFCGIGIQAASGLIAASYGQARQIIGADSLTYLSIDEAINSIGIETEAPNGGLCVASGDYPTPLYDYEDYRKEFG